MVMGSLPERTDLVVIGAGVGGYIAAIRGAELGMSVVLVEKEKLGGHCLNYACIPSKTLLNISKMYFEMRNSEKFGIRAQNATLDPKKMYQWRMDVSGKLESGVGFLCKSNGVEVVKGSAVFLSDSKLQLSNGTEIDFSKAIIATGSEPTALSSFPFGPDVLDYKRALMLDYIPKSMSIIGAGYVAVETATLFARLGTQVNIIARSKLLRTFDQEAVEVVKESLQKLGVKIYEGAAPASKQGNTITLDNGTTITQDALVVAVGLSPYTTGLGLENTTVMRDGKGFIKVDEALRTSNQNIFAIGDVIGEPMLAHKAMRQGVVAAEAAYGMSSAYDNIVVPAVVFSEPEMAIAGTLEGDSIEITKFPMSAIGRAIAMDKKPGFVKIAHTKGGIVKGIEIVAEDAGNLIAEAALAIELGATIEDIADTIHPHPTYTEAIQEAAEAALGRPIHFFYGKQNNKK